MNTKTIERAGIILALVIAVIALVQGGGSQFGAWTGETSHTSSKFDAVGGFAVDGTTVIDTTPGINVASGTFSGDVNVAGESDLDTLIFGGDVTALSGTSSFTITAANICDSMIITVTPEDAVPSTTFPSTTTLAADCFLANGKTQILLFKNLGTSGSTTFIAAGAGIDLVEPDGQNVQIDGGNDALLIVTRYTDGTTTVVVDELIAAD